MTAPIFSSRCLNPDLYQPQITTCRIPGLSTQKMMIRVWFCSYCCLYWPGMPPRTRSLKLLINVVQSGWLGGDSIMPPSSSGHLRLKTLIVVQYKGEEKQFPAKEISSHQDEWDCRSLPWVHHQECNRFGSHSRQREQVCSLDKFQWWDRDRNKVLGRSRRLFHF